MPLCAWSWSDAATEAGHAAGATAVDAAAGDVTAAGSAVANEAGDASELAMGACAVEGAAAGTEGTKS